MEHLQVNPKEEEQFDIVWVHDNVKECYINSNDKSIIAYLDLEEVWMEYTLTENGWISVAAYGSPTNFDSPIFQTKQAIIEIERIVMAYKILDILKESFNLKVEK